jgi:hypothetical protein
MTTRSDTQTTDILVLELEDVATRSSWVSMLGLMSSMTQQWHFVAMLGGRVRYQSPTFAAPYSWGAVPVGKTPLPREEWAPGMTAALDELRSSIAADGWVEVSHGKHPWEWRYRKPGTAPD